MTFTYDLEDPDDIARVRRHLGDTDEQTAIFSDEEIQFAIDEDGGVQEAVIALIDQVIARLSHEPDMTADWLTVSWRRSAEDWLKLRAQKERQFGLGAVFSGGGRHAYRPDSGQKETPDYGEE